MASSSNGASSGSRSSSSEDDSKHILDEKKRKRMVSNRESARRSRIRKQKFVDDLTAQVSQLTKDNNQILTSIDITTQLYTNVEAENSVLRAQMAELSARLQSLNEIVDFINSSNGVFQNHNDNISEAPYLHPQNQISDDDTFVNPWEYFSFYVNQPMMMASADLIMY